MVEIPSTPCLIPRGYGGFMLEIIISFLNFKDLLMFLGFWLDDLGMSKDG
jgi:hypothetical protein